MELFLLILTVVMLAYLILASDDKVRFKKESTYELLIDTSILIDGRFLAVAKTGFVAHKILIPRSVVGELQLLADGGNDDKRTRAREHAAANPDQDWSRPARAPSRGPRADLKPR